MIPVTGFGYALIVLPLLCVWGILYWRSRSTRSEQLLASLLTLPLGVTEMWFTRDYWHPVSAFAPLAFGLDVESFAYAFCIGGVAAVVYEYIYATKYTVHNRRIHPIWFFVVAGAGLLIFWYLALVQGLNSMYVTVGILFLAGVSILVERKDLARDAIMSGFLMALLVVVAYWLFLVPFYPNIFSLWWPDSALVAGIPAGELLFAFAWGFVAGPSYEFINGLSARRSAH